MSKIKRNNGYIDTEKNVFVITNEKITISEPDIIDKDREEVKKLLTKYKPTWIK